MANPKKPSSVPANANPNPASSIAMPPPIEKVAEAVVSELDSLLQPPTLPPSAPGDEPPIPRYIPPPAATPSLADLEAQMKIDSSQQPQTKVSAMDLDKQPHEAVDIDLLYRIYLNKRLDTQAEFYQSRIRENERNADFTFTLGGIVMIASSLIATISASGSNHIYAFLSAILPAVAAVLASFRQLYGWERQTALYRDSLLGLERVRLLAPDNDRVAVDNLKSVFPELVSRSEAVFTGEVNQWGQFIQDKDKAEPQSRGDESLQALISSVPLSEDQLANIRGILTAGRSVGDVSALAAGTVISSALPVPTTTMTANEQAADMPLASAALSDTPAVPATPPAENDPTSVG